MKIHAVNCLACCVCNSPLKLKKGRVRKDSVKNGVLECTECGIKYPVVQGRPVVMTDTMVNRWKSPVDEALGMEEPGTYFDSIDKLSGMGIDDAIDLAMKVLAEEKNAGKEIRSIPKPVIEKMKYRASGKWFNHGDRVERLLTFPYIGKQSDLSFNRFMEAVISSKPEILLDVASGGGFGVSHQAFLNREVRQILAVERDLKCLGNIQYRFRYTGRSDVAEAVGGDARHLPVKSGIVDTVMMLAALPEIYGISAVLREIYRVLKPGGRYTVLVSELPFHTERIPVEDFVRFAEKADLYAGFEQFQTKAENLGFKLIASERHKEDSGKLSRLTVFAK